MFAYGLQMRVWRSALEWAIPHVGTQLMRTLAASFLLAFLVSPPSAVQQEEGDTELEFTGSLITGVGADDPSGMAIA